MLRPHSSSSSPSYHHHQIGQPIFHFCHFHKNPPHPHCLMTQTVINYTAMTHVYLRLVTLKARLIYHHHVFQIQLFENITFDLIQFNLIYNSWILSLKLQPCVKIKCQPSNGFNVINHHHVFFRFYFLNLHSNILSTIKFKHLALVMVKTTNTNAS